MDYRSLQRETRKWIAAHAVVNRGWHHKPNKAAHFVGIAALFIALICSAMFPVVGVVLVPAAVAGILIPIALDRRRAVANTVAAEYPTPLHAMCAFLEHRIDAAEANLFDDGQPLPVMHERLEKLQSEAVVLERTIRERVTTDTSGVLGPEDVAVIAEASRVSSENLARFRTHTDTLHAFFASARDAVRQFTEPESDFGLKRRAHELRAQATATTHEVGTLIAESVTGVAAAIDRTRAEVTDFIEESGMAAAAALPSSGDAEADFAAMNRVITTYMDRAQALRLQLPVA